MAERWKIAYKMSKEDVEQMEQTGLGIELGGCWFADSTQERDEMAAYFRSFGLKVVWSPMQSTESLHDTRR